MLRVRILLSIAFGFFCLLIGHVCLAGLSGSLDEKKIIERLKPVGEVTIEGGGSKSKEKINEILDIGQNRYEQTCQMCHATGLADAPKFGDKAAWKARIDQGMEILIQHSIHGLKAMPPKGGCTSCSDEEIHKAVEYMITHSK